MKKNIFRRAAAALCASVMMSASLMLPAGAEESSEEDKIILPSGIALSTVRIEMENFSCKEDFGSAAVGIFRGDDILLREYYGCSDMGKGIRADEDSVYEWGSISKTMIWVSVMQLWEQGRIDLDRDVREYLPDGFFSHLSYDEPITMIDLMNHDAGWQETTLPIFETDVNRIRPLGEELKRIEPAQIHRPGEINAYSNYGAGVAGYIVECITGMDYCDYVHENILEPLGMEHTSVGPDHSDCEWVHERRPKMKSYSVGTANIIDIGSRLDYISAYPAGAAAGSLEDLIIYAQALADDDAPLFKNKETQELMFTGTSFYGTSDIPMCCHGFWSEEHSVRVIGHSGATTGYQANMIFDPVSKTGLVVMVNTSDGNRFLDLPAYVFGELSPDKYSGGDAVPVGREELNGYYMPARSTYKGMLKFMPYLTAVPLGYLSSKAEHIGGDVVQIRAESTTGGLTGSSEEAVLFGTDTGTDGAISRIQTPSCDFISDRYYMVKLCIFTLYFITAIASFFLILTAVKLKKHGKMHGYAHSKIMLAGRVSRLISLSAFFAAYVSYTKNTGGIPSSAGAVIGVIQMICIAVCAFSAVIPVILYFARKKKGLNPAGYILNVFGNAFSVAAVLCFEMYCFW